MAITPFHFSLQKVSRDQIRLVDMLFHFLPARHMRAKFLHALEEGMKTHIGENVSLHVESINETTFGTFCSRLTHPATIAVLGMLPTEAKIFLDIDPATVFIFIDRILGGKGDHPLTLRKLTDIEEGVLQFLLIQLMTNVRHALDQHLPSHFRFERFASEPSELDVFGDAKLPLILLTVRIKLGTLDGFVRIGFPHLFIQEAFDHRHPEEKEVLTQALETYGFVTTSLWAEVGRTTLTPEDMLALEQGDVILFDESFLTLNGKAPSGRAVIRVGTGREGGYLADIQGDSHTLQCTLRGKS